MSDTEWMEAEAYNLADRMNEALDKAYKQGVSDAWANVKYNYCPNCGARMTEEDV